jgi:pimeloyl-ACP methyl ester carboxylesterase
MVSFIENSWTAEDGTEIVYEVAGPEGAPVVLLCDGVGCEGYIWHYLLPRLIGSYRVIHPFYRGHGLSADPGNLDRVRIEDLCDDLEGILAYEEIECAVTIGHSMGVQVALELVHRAAIDYRGTVLVCGSFGNPLNTFYGTDVLTKIVPVAIRMAERFPTSFRTLWHFAANSPIAWYVSTLTELNPALARREDFERYLKRLGDIDPALFFRMVQAAGAHTAGAYLDDLQLPCLVIAAEDDGYTPMSLSEEMVDTMPNATLMVVPGASHAAPVEVPGPINARITQFLAEIYRSSSSKKIVSVV